MTGRRDDVDWLRVAAVYLLLAFHSAKVFDREAWHVKNGVESGVLDLFTGAVRQWHMPLLFVLAGWAMTPSLDGRGPEAMRRERRDRLLVPFLFGCLALMPGLQYVALRHEGQLDEGFIAFLPTFFTDLDRFTWMHLWFLVYLLVFTLLYLPVFLWVRGRPWRVERVPPWALYGAVVPFVVVQVALRERWPGYQNLYDDWANFAYYSLFFIAGFLLTRFPAIEQAVHRERRRAGCIGIAALAGMGALAGGLYAPEEGTAQWFAFQALSAVSGVCLVAALLGYANKYLSSSAPTRQLAYARDSAMPVYVLHQPFIIVLAVPLVGIPAGVPAKFGLLLAASTAATMAAHHFLVRRAPLLRTLLGARRGARSQRRTSATMAANSRARYASE